MKRIFLLLSFLVCFFVSKAQILQKQNTYGIGFNRTGADTLIYIPSDTLSVPSWGVGKTHIARKGTTLYYWDGSKWSAISGSGGTYTAGNGLTLSGSQFKLGSPLTENTTITTTGYDFNLPGIPTVSSTTRRKVVLIDTVTGKVERIDPSTINSNIYNTDGTIPGQRVVTIPDGSELQFFLDVVGKFNVTNDAGDTIIYAVGNSGLYLPSVPTVSSTTGRKVALIDTATGKVERIDPASLGGSQNLQQVTDNGDTTTNAIQFMERRSVLGTILSDNYTGGGFGSNYDSSFASLTRTFNGSYLEVTGGNGTFNNYVRYNQWNGLNNWTQSVKFVPTNLSGTTYGIGLGSYSSNSFYTSGFVIQFILDNGSDKGKMRIWSNGGGSNVETGLSACAFNTTDTLIATVNYLDGVVTATLYNKSQNVSATYTYTFSRSVAGSFQAPNTGKLSMYFFGGTQKIFNYTISSNETKNNVVVLGNSITYGYTASEAAKRWVQKLFPGRYSYETSGGPGDRSAEGVQVLPQIKSLSPKYVILALGVNDAQNSVSGSTYSSNITTIVDTLLDNGITPILLSNSPLNSTSVVPYNDTLQAIATRWGIAYINTFDSLKGSGTSWKANYTTDNIHPNDSGHLVIARIIERNAPQIMGDTVIYTNRVKYNPDIRYFFGLNEKTGAMELNQSIISDTSAYNNFVRLSPLSTQTGASIDVTGDGGTTDNIAIFRSAATYSNIVIDATKGGGTGQASLWFNTNGTNKWQFGSDFAANGTKDFYIYDNASTRNPLYVTTGGDVRLGGTSGYAGTQAMTIKQTGEVGIVTTSPNSKLDVSGSVGAAITTTSTNLTLDATHYTVIVTSGTPTITLPAAASGNSRRIYVVVNQTGSGVTISSYLDFTGAGNTTVAANSAIQIQSNGTNWYRIL